MGGPALTVYGNVGHATGRISHEGDVRVFGSVLPGFEVAAGGDLFISRNLCGARALAGGDLTVNGIVAGRGSVLDAVGSLTVRQVVDAELHAGLDVVVRAASERARIFAGRRILFFGRPGTARGGCLRAGSGVEARRLLPSGGRAVRVVVGGSPFLEDREQLAERLSFARHRAAVASLDRPAAVEEYRRRVADVAAYRSLSASLERRLRRLETAGSLTAPPYLRVTGPGPVEARVSLGPVEAGPWSAPEWRSGEFLARLAGDEVRVSSLKEPSRVG